jgi:hypothetical protein
MTNRLPVRIKQTWQLDLKADLEAFKGLNNPFKIKM